MTTETTITDAMMAGAAGLGLAALVVLVALVIPVIRFATTGRVPAAVLCGMALVAMINPFWGLVLALLILIATAFIGDLRLGGSAFLGWGIGLVFLVVIVAVGMATGVLVAVQ